MLIIATFPRSITLDHVMTTKKHPIFQLIIIETKFSRDAQVSWAHYRNNAIPSSEIDVSASFKKHLKERMRGTLIKWHERVHIVHIDRVQ